MNEFTQSLFRGAAVVFGGAKNVKPQGATGWNHVKHGNDLLSRPVPPRQGSPSQIAAWSLEGLKKDLCHLQVISEL